MALSLSLWLIPPRNSDSYAYCSRIINSLITAAHPGPIFEPHITITSGIPLETDAAALVQDVATYVSDLRVECIGTRFGDYYFKCSYLAVRKTPELRDFAARVRQKYTAETDAIKWGAEEYDPHISLEYNNSLPFQEEHVAEVTQIVETILDGNTVAWTNGRLALVRCVGPVEEWEVLATHDL